MSCTVNNSNENFSFNGKISVPFRNTWKLYSDINATNEITSNVVELQEGDNTFYLLVISSNNDKKLYTVTIRRKPMYTVTFDTDGGTVVEQQIIEEGSLACLPNQPTKTGYTFINWNFDFIHRITSNTTIIAQWRANTDTPYQIRHYLETLSGSYVLHETDNLIGTSDQDAQIMSNAKLYDHFYVQYNTSANIINRYGTSIFSLYYTRASYTVIFNGNGGNRNSGGNETQTIKYEGSASAPNYRYTGYNFEGFDKTFDYITEDIIVNATWSYCTLTTNTNKEIAGTYTIYTDSKITQNTRVTLTAETTDSSAYNFLGWYNGENLLSNSLQYKFNMPKQNLVITAKWEAVTYNISYILDYGTLPDDLNPSTYTIESNIILNNPSRDYYDFVGWFINDTQIESINGNYTEDLTLTGKWENKIFVYLESNIETNCYITGLTDYGKTLSHIDIVAMSPDRQVYGISGAAFSNCQNLTTINLGNNLAYIGERAFYHSGLTSLFIPDSVGDNYCYNFIAGCDNLIELSLTSVRTTSPNSLYTTSPIAYGSSLNFFTYFGGNNCQKLTIRGDTSIPNYAFSGADNIIELHINESTHYIGESAFSGLINLTTLSLSNGLTRIGRHAFSACRSLTEIILPQTVERIYDEAFYACTSLEFLIFNQDSQLIEIGNHVFYGCNLQNVVLPESLTTIGDGVFESCRQMNYIIIPNSVNNIGSYTFKWCNILDIFLKNSNIPTTWDENWNSDNRPVYFYSETEPTGEGNYWHYVDNTPTIWE